MIRVELPTLHAGQRQIWQNRTSRNVVSCGRRFGKTVLLETIASDAVLKGRRVGVFTPEHAQWLEIWAAMRGRLTDLEVSANKSEKQARYTTGGKADFWSINDNPLAGRGREYDVVLLDEAAFATGTALQTFERAIAPTVLVSRGDIWVFSTPNGVREDNLFYALARNEKYGFKFHHAPTSANPFVPLEDLADYERQYHPMVFQQEYLAQFVDWGGQSLFALEKLGPHVPPARAPEYIFATIDTAVKTGKEHDGTACVIWAKRFDGLLEILDWDIIQIEGASLSTWLPSVFMRCNDWAKALGCVRGSIGAFIEDRASGQILLQQARNQGWPAHPIDSALTAQGKDERALNVINYVHQKRVVLTEPAFTKTTDYKGVHANHLVRQITTFRIGAKDGQSDDLLDAFAYGITVGIGGSDGF